MQLLTEMKNKAAQISQHISFKYGGWLCLASFGCPLQSGGPAIIFAVTNVATYLVVQQQQQELSAVGMYNVVQVIRKLCYNLV